MTTTTNGTFTAAGQASSQMVVRNGEKITAALSGTWVGRITLQRMLGAGAAWETLDSSASNADALDYPGSGGPSATAGIYRLYCAGYTSGTVSYSLTVEDDGVVSGLTANDIAIPDPAALGLPEGVTDVQELAAHVGGLVDVQEFNADGTYTKPEGAKMVYVFAVGAGGGGGGGARYASGNATAGGGGGGAGAIKKGWFLPSLISDAVAVTIGTAGAGGAGATSDGNGGANGAAGGNTTFGAYLTAHGGGRGAGGRLGAASGGGASAGTRAVGGDATTSTAGTAGVLGGANGGSAAAGANNTVSGLGSGGGGSSNSADAGAGGITLDGPGGGGAGAGVTAVPAALVPGNGGRVAELGNSAASTDGVLTVYGVGTGGGGGIANIAGAGGNGGNGVRGDGGGGGGSGIGGNGGSGGNGGGGYLRVVTFR